MPFGQCSALQFTDEARCGEFLAELPEAPSRFGAIGAPDAFSIRLRNVSLPNVSLVAGSSSPKATDHVSRRVALVIPFAGSETVLRAEREEYRWAAPHHAFFIPAGATIEAESTTGAFLRLDIVESALARVAAGMASQEKRRAPAIDLGTTRVVPMRTHASAWLPVIRSICGTIDAFDCSAERLAAVGIDDVILRTVALMLRPELTVEHGASTRPTRRFDLEPLLERVGASLGGRVTMADLEAWSGLSARAIQLAFQRRFGIGPMQWIRDRRLDLVRAKLLAAPAGATVREIAVACGMPRMGTLVPEYVARFGERPSDTLQARGGGR
jgi:AraC-like DNA-binding protein